MKGLFITFEGPDGSGKSTQIKKLADYLELCQIPYILTREPGGTEISDVIRSLILNPAYVGLTDKTEILLYAASRAQHVKQKIKPSLKEGKIVLCDRFIDASIAYQGYGLGAPIEQVKAINHYASEGLEPDRTYLIDISPESARERMQKRAEKEYNEDLDRIEQRKYAYHRRVREGFKAIRSENKQRICFINGDQSQDDVFKIIQEDFIESLKQFSN
ncbi:dTMP kinase [Scopulibacillus darangshiensis]|uniref:Thymidylate kinase n=1 Tax=Scopulibacillus darangshiensis TaxID=442528 RepID=A0A4R2NLR0_9BACL|nr:dTMP kinase [Scopulibacillus darangshiensis]